MTEHEAIAAEPVSIDALILANAAEVKEGLAYVLGGGWTRCWPTSAQGYPFNRATVAIIMIRIPWTETNREHTFSLAFRNADEEDLMKGQLTGAFTAGREPDHHPGMSQVITIAVGANVPLPTDGIYHVVVEVNGVEAKRIQFEALERAPSAGLR